ncbi:MAG: DUF1259 domain-containing protein, partial [Thermoanaerobaculia bacterium]
MNRLLVLVALFLTACASAPMATPVARTDWSGVEAALGRSGSAQPGNVYKFGFPRSDLDVRIGGVRLKPALALGSWAAFMDLPNGYTMAMGDLVLTEGEVNDVISALQAGGIEQSALHNHVLGETPRVMYLHFSGHGEAVALARTLRAALERTKTPLQPSAGTAPPPDLPASDMDRILGYPGKPNGGVLQYSVPRTERIVEHGTEVPPAAGTATAINFQPTGNGRAAISGDFVMLANEMNPVIRELRNGGIDITALHSHMLDEEPRLFFMHFWANEDAVKLATALRR